MANSVNPASSTDRLRLNPTAANTFVVEFQSLNWSKCETYAQVEEQMQKVKEKLEIKDLRAAVLAKQEQSFYDKCLEHAADAENPEDFSSILALEAHAQLVLLIKKLKKTLLNEGKDIVSRSFVGFSALQTAALREPWEQDLCQTGERLRKLYAELKVKDVESTYYQIQYKFYLYLFAAQKRTDSKNDIEAQKQITSDYEILVKSLDSIHASNLRNIRKVLMQRKKEKKKREKLRNEKRFQKVEKEMMKNPEEENEKMMKEEEMTAALKSLADKNDAANEETGIKPSPVPSTKHFHVDENKSFKKLTISKPNTNMLALNKNKLKLNKKANKTVISHQQKQEKDNLQEKAPKKKKKKKRSFGGNKEKGKPTFQRRKKRKIDGSDSDDKG
jgi:hypothetical protein